MYSKYDYIEMRMYMKQWFVIMILGVLLLAGDYFYPEESPSDIQAHISQEIIRFHCIANSDMESDQNIKLKVKDAVVASLREELKDARDIGEARTVIQENLPFIEKTANQVLSDSGYSYTASASLERCDFPVKQYGDLTFPAGNYEALRIQLGGAKGKNWWCVMFPSLCYVDEAYDVITEENKEKFQEVLTEEEFDSLTADGSGQVFHKLAVVSWLERIFCNTKSTSDY